MGVYQIDGSYLDNVYYYDGNLASNAYDIEGEHIYPEGHDPYIDGRVLLFEDDFDGEELNQTVWNYDIGTQYGDGRQLQFYRSSNNVSLENSCLVITAKKENYLNKGWTSGRINSHYKKSWLYGRFESKIKFSKSNGMFPAFWTKGVSVGDVIYDENTGEVIERIPGDTSQVAGEIDIMEILLSYNPSADKAYATIWSNDSSSSLGTYASHPINIEAWHVYAIEWTEDYIAAMVDGIEYHRWLFSDYDSSSVRNYHQPHFPILNLAIGGMGGEPDPSTTEMKMMVDWFRVYAPKE